MDGTINNATTGFINPTSFNNNSSQNEISESVGKEIVDSITQNGTKTDTTNEKLDQMLEGIKTIVAEVQKISEGLSNINTISNSSDMEIPAMNNLEENSEVVPENQAEPVLETVNEEPAPIQETANNDTPFEIPEVPVMSDAEPSENLEATPAAEPITENNTVEPINNELAAPALAEQNVVSEAVPTDNTIVTPIEATTTETNNNEPTEIPTDIPVLPTAEEPQVDPAIPAIPVDEPAVPFDLPADPVDPVGPVVPVNPVAPDANLGTQEVTETTTTESVENTVPTQEASTDNVISIDSLLSGVQNTNTVETTNTEPVAPAQAEAPVIPIVTNTEAQAVTPEAAPVVETNTQSPNVTVLDIDFTEAKTEGTRHRSVSINKTEHDNLVNKKVREKSLVLAA